MPPVHEAHSSRGIALLSPLARSPARQPPLRLPHLWVSRTCSDTPTPHHCSSARLIFWPSRFLKASSLYQYYYFTSDVVCMLGIHVSVFIYLSICLVIFFFGYDGRFVHFRLHESKAAGKKEMEHPVLFGSKKNACCCCCCCRHQGFRLAPSLSTAACSWAPTRKKRLVAHRRVEMVMQPKKESGGKF